MKVFITGGAGYIGNHMALSLLDHGHDVVILDDLSTGFKNLIPSKAIFIEGNINNLDLVNKILTEHRFDAVAHFARSIQVEESVYDPVKYYQNNTINTLRFVNLLSKSKTKKLIFSSTAADYDISKNILIKESNRLKPLNPYGSSKQMYKKIVKTSLNWEQSLLV